MILPSRRSALAWREVRIVDRGEGSRVGGDGSEHLAQLHGGNAAILIDDSHPQFFDFPAEGIAQHYQLHQGKEHGNHNQGGAAHEPAHVALDDGKHAVHINPSLAPC